MMNMLPCDLNYFEIYQAQSAIRRVTFKNHVDVHSKITLTKTNDPFPDPSNYSCSLTKTSNDCKILKEELIEESQLAILIYFYGSPISKTFCSGKRQLIIEVLTKKFFNPNDNKIQRVLDNIESKSSMNLKSIEKDNENLCKDVKCEVVSEVQTIPLVEIRKFQGEKVKVKVESIMSPHSITNIGYKC